MDNKRQRPVERLDKFSNHAVLITGARAPVALHMARLLHRAGYRTILADSFEHPLSRRSKCCHAYITLPSPRFEPARYAASLQQEIASNNISMVIPTCEEVFYLAKVWQENRMKAKLFAPEFELLRQCHNKYLFIRLAESFGLKVPETVLITDKSGMNTFISTSRDHVFKKAWSRFATNVLIRPSPNELDSISPTPEDPWIGQRFIEGEEISAYAVASSGKVKAIALYRSLYRAGKGAGVCFEQVENENCSAFVEVFVKNANWTGQISFDFMRKPNGDILPLECNPRATSGLHFFTHAQGFSDAVLANGSPIAADAKGVLGVNLATLIYGVPKALRTGNLGAFMNMYRDMTDVLDWPGDTISMGVQIRSMQEIAAIALRQRISLQAASTRDIEWNGDSQSSM